MAVDVPRALVALDGTGHYFRWPRILDSCHVVPSIARAPVTMGSSSILMENGYNRQLVSGNDTHFVE